MNDTDDKGVFEFKYTDADGGTNALKFSADTWTEALEKFIQFLRGSGFFLDYNSIAVNTDKHQYFSSDLLGSFSSEEDSDSDLDFPEINENLIPCCDKGCNKHGGNE